MKNGILKNKKMYLEIKETIWRKVHLKKDVTKDQIVDWLKNRNIDEIYDDEKLYDEENELLINTTTSMQDPFFCQNGYSTIELWSDEGSILWENGSK